MASFIGSQKKADLKPSCAYFDTVMVLHDTDQGTKGQERAVCRNKRLNGPISCKGCPFFSETIVPDDETSQAMMEADPRYRDLEDSILDMEAARTVKDQAEAIYESRRQKVKHIVWDELGVKKVVLNNKAVTISERFTDKWIPDELKKRLTKLSKSAGLDLTDKVFKRRTVIEFDLNDTETASAIAEFVEKLSKKSDVAIVESNEVLKDDALQAMVEAGIIKREDLEGTYESKVSRWPLIKDVVRKDEPAKVVFI